ncbi:MAG: hypothetical protein Q9200_003044 [Gallowayella weberi]
MPPKPFPFPIGVGVDICHVSRLSRLLLNKQDDFVTRWARRVFTRHEWPHLWEKFHEAGALHMTSKVPQPQLFLPNLCVLPHQKTDVRQDTTRTDQTQDTERFPSLVDEWAAKEAAVKASRHRRLLLRDISIVQANSNNKVQALVAPIRTVEIVMDPIVAQQRGIKEARSPHLGVEGMVIGGQFFKSVRIESSEEVGSMYFIRRAKIKDDERQVAEISISHDDDYAVAVCMALDERTDVKESIKHIVDDGSGEPLHEPDWGDIGWLEDRDSTDTGDRQDVTLS